MISVGLLLLLLSFPSTFYNERKYLNLSKADAVIKERLYRADEKENTTSKDKENMLVFA